MVNSEFTGSTNRRKILQSTSGLIGSSVLFSGLSESKIKDNLTKTDIVEVSLTYDGLPSQPVSSGDPFPPYYINIEEKSLTLHQNSPAVKENFIRRNESSIVTPGEAHGAKFTQRNRKSNHLVKSTGYRNLVDEVVSLQSTHQLPFVNINI